MELPSCNNKQHGYMTLVCSSVALTFDSGTERRGKYIEETITKLKGS